MISTPAASKAESEDSRDGLNPMKRPPSTCMDKSISESPTDNAVFEHRDYSFPTERSNDFALAY